MNTRLVIACSVLFWIAPGRLFSAEPMTVRSQSGQFLVRGLPWATPLASSTPLPGVSYVRLDPKLVTVSCERIKEALLQELRMNDQWRGAIYISLHPVRQDNESIVVTSVRYIDGWSYRVDAPEQVNTARFIKAVTQVLLLEIANRQPGPHPVELPLWLTEGLASHLQATAALSLTVEPNMRIVRDERNRDPLALARARLRAHSPLTLNELNWPTEEQLLGQNAEVYQSCAHLFVHELLRLKNGPEKLRRMLAGLPDHLNWQTSFLQAFKAYFPRLIDVDKWWALNVVHLTGRDLMSMWPREESVRRLDEILGTTVQLRVIPKELPMSAEVRLQNIIAEWEFSRQTPVLLQKMNYLEVLRMRAAHELAGLVEAYRQTLEAYLQRRNQAAARAALKNQPSPSTRLIVDDTIERLDDLDKQREWQRKQMSVKTAVRVGAAR